MRKNEMRYLEYPSEGVERVSDSVTNGKWGFPCLTKRKVQWEYLKSKTTFLLSFFRQKKKEHER